MTVQLLVAALAQEKNALLEKLNVQSDVIVANQCDKNEFEAFEWRGHAIRYLNLAERGVGLNRNNALMRASGDVCLLADDDMTYVDGYPQLVEKTFEELPGADVLIFNLIEKTPTRPVITRVGRVRFYNYLRYGAARIAFKTAAVRQNGIYFNQCFGGGTEHCHGEDNIFLAQCLKRGLKVYAVPKNIAELTEERPSGWNRGYDEKYLKDQGCLYRQLSRRWWRLLCLQDALRHSGEYNMKWTRAYSVMKGQKD